MVSPTFVPYTTLFRSPLSRRLAKKRRDRRRDGEDASCRLLLHDVDRERYRQAAPAARGARCRWRLDGGGEGGLLASPARSEEHTSELQSRANIVCRLL